MMADPTCSEALEIRQVQQADLALLDQYVKAAPGRTVQQELDDQTQGLQSIYIVLKARQVIGWGFVFWRGPRDSGAAALFPAAPEIFRLEVIEAERSRGIGRQLINHMERAIAANGFAHSSLGVAHANPRAYALYQALGYEDTSLTHYYDEYDYLLPSGELQHARDLCRYLIKPL